jgi:hypothetical protein
MSVGGGPTVAIHTAGIAYSRTSESIDENGLIARIPLADAGATPSSVMTTSQLSTNPVRAYVAGLLAADGNVLERQRRVSLELSRRDRELVYFVRDELAPGFPVRERVRPNGVATAVLAITSTQLCEDLSRLGITPRKSLTLSWPRQHLGRVSSRLFLLGYFDGDGFITQSRNGRYVYPRWGLLGTEMFLSAAMGLISCEAGVSPRRVRRQRGKNVHTLHINGADAVVVDRWLHYRTSLGLARKRLTCSS